MSRLIPIDDLATSLRVEDAVASACAKDIDYIAERLLRKRSVLVECDKEISLYLFLAIRDRIKRVGDAPKITIIDGRPKGKDGEAPTGVGRMLQQLTQAVRGNVQKSILVMNHLDVLTASDTGLTLEARETIPLLFENPEVVVLGFRDPSFRIPKVIENVFAAKRSISGIPRECVPSLITQREALAIDAEGFDAFALYKYISGLNPVRVRHLLDTLNLKREARAGAPRAKSVYKEIREQTLIDGVEMPSVNLDTDIGGYDDVKARLKEELIELAEKKESASHASVQAIEELLPRGIMFHGPPGTGKTHFAKALATSLNASLTVISGPELKSKWVGESEENLRRIFRTARKAAPSVIVFDEIDAFAAARGTYTGSGVEHSMVNQLLTEMDGFRSNEMVFVVATTNFLKSVDPALLRPGRFEFLIEIGAPNHDEREAISRIYNKKFELKLNDKLIAHLVRRTQGPADRQQPFTGDHIHALFRSLKRLALREERSAFTKKDIDDALSRKSKRVVLSEHEEHVIAVHEAGHALLAMLIDDARPPERIAIAQDHEGALGYVTQAASTRPYAMTENDIRAEICVSLGGICAERLVFEKASVGAYNDLQHANALARAMVTEYGMSQSLNARALLEKKELSESMKMVIDKAIDELLAKQYERAQSLLFEHRAKHKALTALLLEHKVLEGEILSQVGV